MDSSDEINEAFLAMRKKIDKEKMQQALCGYAVLAITYDCNQRASEEQHVGTLSGLRSTNTNGERETHRHRDGDRVMLVVEH